MTEEELRDEKRRLECKLETEELTDEEIEEIEEIEIQIKELEEDIQRAWSSQWDDNSDEYHEAELLGEL